MNKTASYKKFKENILEVRSLRKKAKTLSKKLGTPSYKISQTLCRSGIVLLCAYVEAYFEDIIEEILQQAYPEKIPKEKFGDRMLIGLSRDLIDRIFSTDDPVKRARHVKHLFKRDADIWSSDTHFNSSVDYEKIIEIFSSPSFDKICQLLSTVGFVDFKTLIKRKLAKNGPILIQAVDSMVEKRNLIAHGDIAAVSIAPHDLEELIKQIDNFCKSSDTVVTKWAEGIGCSFAPITAIVVAIPTEP